VNSIFVQYTIKKFQRFNWGGGFEPPNLLWVYHW